ncbi:MAG: hypothetical protein P9M08_12195 [Candidatus Erginobacter occultus]|nr:hypothetical protein [Candidatus Erginobacter occultus]
MKRLKLLILSLGISLLVWSIWSWPLPRNVSRGIPMTHSGGQGWTVRFMVAGDHLQLLYYFWLFGDMLSGDTPWMYNPYEFNTGDETARYEPGPYYAPFSWLYCLLAPISNRAFAYNLTGFFSIWLTYLFTWLLVRRYLSSDGLAAAGALIAIILPYRWITLLGGSPTGFAMAATPLLLWGLDRAVRDRSLAGGFWAAVAIVFSYTSDLHIFFFNVLLTPAWCLVALAAGGLNWRSPKAYRRSAAAILPVVAGVAVTVLYSLAVSEKLAGTVMAEGRTLDEVAIFSPRPRGFLGGQTHQVSDQVFLGYPLLVLLLAGAGAIGIRLVRERPRPYRDARFYLLLLAAVAVIAMLATGPFGPHGGVFWRKAREWIPHYEMIRQTGKVYGILPPILALLAALAAAAIARAVRLRAAGYLAAAACLLLSGVEYRHRFEPVICLLSFEQPAYAAVAEDAAERGIRPHILAIPLWPGDSHYASIYQYYCSLYRIRMLNGYTPAVGGAYFDEIFLPYQSINQGWLTDEQADSLIDRGITHLVLHEDIFPDKVSPFPHSHTLAALLDSPRLELLRRDGPVWAFRIREEPAPAVGAVPGTDLYFPSRHWLFDPAAEESEGQTAVRDDRTASRGRYLELSPGAAVLISPTDAPPAPDLRWMIRLRGRGRLLAEVIIDDRVSPAEAIPVNSADWSWVSVPAPTDDFSRLSLRLTLQSGSADLCSALLTAGGTVRPGEEDILVLPAYRFFHRGSSDPDQQDVHFRGGIDQPGWALWGPQLPLPAGRYEVSLHFDSPAPPGTVLGSFHFEQFFTEAGRVGIPVTAGAPAGIKFTIQENLPWKAACYFYGNADLTIRDLAIRRRDREEQTDYGQ